MPVFGEKLSLFFKCPHINVANVWTRLIMALFLLFFVGLVFVQTYIGMCVERLLDQAQEQIDLFAFEPGINLLNRAIALEPKHYEAHLLLANTYRTLARFRTLERSQFEKLALEQYTLSAQANPYSAYVHYQNSLFYSEQKRYVEALPFVERSLTLDPNNAGYWLEKGRLLEAAHRLREARMAYLESEGRVPNAEAQMALERLKGYR